MSLQIPAVQPVFIAPTGPQQSSGSSGGGGSGIILSVSAPALQVPATAGGFVSDFSLAVGQAFMFNGSANVNAQTTFSIATQNNCSAAITTGGAYSFSALSQNVGSIVIQAIYLAVTYSITVTISKQIPGSTGATGLTGPAGSTGPIGPGGISGLTLVLSNPAATVLAYANGNVPSFAGISGTATVLSGGIDVTASSVLSAVAASLTGTVNSAANTPVTGHGIGYYQVTAMSATIGTLTITAQYLGTNVTQVFNVTQVPTGYQIVSALPGPTDPATFLGNVVFLTTDKKLYRYNGTAWVASVAATDMTGQLTAAQIASIAAAQITGTLTAAQIASIASTQITGQLTNVQIASLDASQLTGLIQAPQINSIAATQVTGALTSSQIASVAAATITGQITNTQIGASAIQTAQLAAGSVTTAVLAAGAVTAGTIAAGAVTAAAITAGSITTAQIASGTILAGNISANTITGSQIAAGAISTVAIAAGAVSTAQLAANAVTAGTIAANAITTAAISAGAVTTAQIAAGTIVAGNIASATITGTQIAASTIASGNIAAGTIVAGNIAAATITGTQIAAGSILANNIATNSITANQILAGTITAAQMGVTSLSSMTANLGAITAGTISALSGQALIDMNNGFIEWNNGVSMKVSGVGFGASSNYIEWFGPTQSSASNFSACTDALGAYWIKTDGTYKFGMSQQQPATTVSSATQGAVSYDVVMVTIPAGKTTMTLELWGSTGVGNQGNNSIPTQGGSGASGSYAKSQYNVSGAAGQTVTANLSGGIQAVNSTIVSGTFSITTMTAPPGGAGQAGTSTKDGVGGIPGAVATGGNLLNLQGFPGGGGTGTTAGLYNTGAGGPPVPGQFAAGNYGSMGLFGAGAAIQGLGAVMAVTFS